MSSGYIKIYRELRDHPYYGRPGFAQMWLHILLNTQYQAGIRVYRGKSITLNQGEFVFGRRRYAREMGLSERRIRTLMSLLVKEKMISPVSHKATRLFSVFLVENWVEYQEIRPIKRPAGDPPNDHETDPQIPVDNDLKPSHKATRETPTYKEYKEVRKTPPKNGVFSYEEVLEAVHEGITMTDFEHQEDGTWLRK